MSWMIGQRPPSASLQMIPISEECLVDLSHGGAALQRCIDRLEKWAEWFVMKFWNESCTWAGIMGSPIAGWRLACWNTPWHPGASHTDHEPTVCPHGKESHQPCGMPQAQSKLIQVACSEGRGKRNKKTQKGNTCLRNSASAKIVPSFCTH